MTTKPDPKAAAAKPAATGATPAAGTEAAKAKADPPKRYYKLDGKIYQASSATRVIIKVLNPKVESVKVAELVEFMTAGGKPEVIPDPPIKAAKPAA
jgi:hypothetical protein